MQVVYEAENLLDGHLVRGLLEQHGIAAFVTGQYLTGALGELPVHGLVTVLVHADNMAEALRVVAQLQLDRSRDFAAEEAEAEPALPGVDLPDVPRL